MTITGDTSETLVYSRPVLAERFEILETVGSGAAGTVFRALDRMHSRKEVALKVLVNKSAFDENTMQRFLNELEVCQGLRHPNLIEAYDLVRLPDGIAYTMEFVRGHDLATLIRQRIFHEEDLDKLFSQLLSALDTLHQAGIMHRDIKLENILISKDGHVKLVDLGLMKQVEQQQKLTQTGILLGTAQYMPPEYVKHGRYDQRSDLYAVGLMLYELLRGERRYIGKPGAEILRTLIKNRFKIEPLTHSKAGVLSERYQRILARALHPKPEKRYQSAAEMKAEFEPHLAPPKPELDATSSINSRELNSALRSRRRGTGEMRVFDPIAPKNRVRVLIKVLSGCLLALLALSLLLR